MQETLHLQDLEKDIEGFMLRSANFTVKNLSLREQFSTIKIIKKIALNNQIKLRFYPAARWDVVKTFLSLPFVIIFTGLTKGRLDSLGIDLFWIITGCSIGMALLLTVLIFWHELVTLEPDYEIKMNYKQLTADYTETHFKENL